jgi:hypothetical protein
MANKRLVTELFKTNMARQLVESLTEQSNTAYYMFTGKHTQYPDGDTTVTQPVDTTQSLYIDMYENMLFGKRITANDVKHMVQRNTWASGTVYSMYEQDNADLFSEKFFVVVNEASLYHVFKCLYNNGGAESTIQPSFSVTSADDTFYETSDGYQWKYMYTVDSTTFNKFSTLELMPIVESANVSGNAVSGAIDVITVINGGAGYNNYLEGQFNSTDIKISGDNLAYAVSANASSTNNFYNNCYLYIIGGNAGVGEYKKIVDYINDGVHKKVIVESPFVANLNGTSTYVISPIVEITSDQNQTVNCIARALVNSTSSNSIYKIEIIDRGADYRIASASVLYSNVVPVSNTAGLKVIIGPKGGHGSNPIDELGGTRVGFSVKFSNTESSTIQASNDFRTAGILKDPLFTGVDLNTSGTVGTFAEGEIVYQYNPVALDGTLSISDSTSSITGTGTTFDTQLQPGDFILISAGTNKHFGIVNNVSSDTTFYLTSNGSFTNSTSDFALLETAAYGSVTDVSTGLVQLTDVSGVFSNSKTIIGKTSSATATIDTIDINGVRKGFNTFNQMKVFVGTTSKSFANDETVSQALGGNAKFHSINSGKMFVTNQLGIININDSVVGHTSGATFSITSKYQGDIVVDSGDVIYVENFPAIERASDRSETIKVIVEF